LISTRVPTCFDKSVSLTSTYTSCASRSSRRASRTSLSSYSPVAVRSRQPLTLTSLPPFSSTLVFETVFVSWVCAASPVEHRAAKLNATVTVANDLLITGLLLCRSSCHVCATGAFGSQLSALALGY